jgi:CBS domain-containing protein
MATLADIMTSDPYTVSGDDTVAEVARVMVKSRFGSALVLQGGVLAGIFTERDVLRAAADGGDLTAAKVSHWMTRNPVTAEPATTTDDAAQEMISNGFRHLPVCEGTTVLGIVSLRDILAARIKKT